MAGTHTPGARTARTARVPYLIAAHGMAEPWALRHKRWKKRVYLALVEARNLRRASCLHALSRPEIGHLRKLAPWTPICFIPNGVDLEAFDNLPPKSALEAECPELAGKFVLLFYGRVHVKKGLDLLAEALGQVAPDHPEVHLLIAGTDDGALSPFHDRIAELGLTRRLTYLGHVAGERARRVWAAADAFILPSYSEGFSMAILEAMACRLPCLITTTCHFPEAAGPARPSSQRPTPRPSREDCANCWNAQPTKGSSSVRTPAPWSKPTIPGTARPNGSPVSTTGWPAAGHPRRSLSNEIESARQRDRARQERGRKPQSLPTRAHVGRRGFCRG